MGATRTAADSAPEEAAAIREEHTIRAMRMVFRNPRSVASA